MLGSPHDLAPSDRLSVVSQLAEICLRPVAPGDRTRAALHVLDWAGCAVSGAASRTKRLRIHGLDAESVRMRLADA